MSARAAWRLESLGYSNVSRYTAGKVDWLANGLPSEGELASEPRISGLVRTQVATCGLSDRVGDIEAAEGLCVVVNERRVILGDLRKHALSSPPETRVEEVMDPGPVTYRPNLSVHDTAHHMAESGARRVLVSDADGHLIGVLLREDVERALAGPVLANHNGKEAHSHG